MKALAKLKDALLRPKPELPCGCPARMGSLPRFSPDTEELDTELVTLTERKYRECTRYEQEWKHRLRCKKCGAEFTHRKPAGSHVDFGDENPDADMRLNIKMRGPHVIYNEEPIIEESDKE